MFIKMRNDKITLTFKETVERKLECWPPKSKYILQKNLLLICMFVIMCSLMLLLAVCIGDKIIIAFWTFITLLIHGTVIYETWNEWTCGKNYKAALKIVRENTTQEERDELIKKLQDEQRERENL